MKAAALQSLMLVKQEPKNEVDLVEMDRLKADKEDLTRQVRASLTSIRCRFLISERRAVDGELPQKPHPPMRSTSSRTLKL